MNAFSATELSRMRSTQESAMMDYGAVIGYTFTLNSFGEEVASVPVERATILGLEMRPGSIREDPDKTPVVYDATARLPITTTVGPKDQLKVTKRFGETLATALTFNLVGTVQRGPSGIRLLLQKVNV
jgi:hypothetical protein